MEPSIEPNVPYSFDSPSGCTSVEALSSNKFRLISSSGGWKCGICGTTPITGFEVRLSYANCFFAIGLNPATRACQSEHWDMYYSLIFRGHGGYQLESYETYSGFIARVYDAYLSTDVFGIALHNNKVHYLKNGVVFAESPMVPDVDYWFDYSAGDSYCTTGINVTFVDPLSHWDAFN
jgi:hypothetical protein